MSTSKPRTTDRASAARKPADVVKPGKPATVKSRAAKAKPGKTGAGKAVAAKGATHKAASSKSTVAKPQLRKVAEPHPLAALTTERLRPNCDLSALAFETTAELPDLTGIIGQDRAGAAIEFGLAIPREGYNLFVMGPAGRGKRSLVEGLLRHQAATQATPGDWVYVHNFAQPHKPNAIQLTPGQGRQLKADMQHLIEDMQTTIQATFESDEYRARVEQIEAEFSEVEAAAFRALGEEAGKHSIALVRTPNGFGLAPMKGDEVLDPEEFEKLPAKDKTRIARALEKLHEKLHKLIRQAPQWVREKKARIRGLNREFSMLAVEHLISELKEKYRSLAEVIDYLDAVQKDLIENADEFRKPQDGPAPAMTLSLQAVPVLRRYQVNVLVERAAEQGAPIIWPDHPSYPNLVGRIEHLEHLGALVTDFTLIKPGALHQANGGYLVLDARKLLMQPYAYEALKRALNSRSIRIDSLSQMLGLSHTVALEPEPIPLDVKVIVLGERLVYYLLYEYDPDFQELFKVVADFEDELPRDAESNRLYCGLIATLARKEQLLSFERAACARLIERMARDAEDAERLSTDMRHLLDLMREAEHIARRDGLAAVPAEAVQQAIADRGNRAGRVRERIREEILRGTVHIATGEYHVGQINGLSVIQLGDMRFAHPTRITATVRLGDGEVIDIAREVNLGGAIHSKGVLILASFLATRYASSLPLSLAASLVFEQTYAFVEGDSASMAELCALMSAIGDVPINQAIAVTGSVDQYGQMQAIGGVNEKIEGYFDLCAARGLTGEQGVIIPESNVKDLMLREDVVQACSEGRFHVWPVADVDQAITRLTGLPAGMPDADGVVPEGSVNYLVAARIIQFSNLRQAYSGHVGNDETAPRRRKAGTDKTRKRPAKGDA